MEINIIIIVRNCIAATTTGCKIGVYIFLLSTGIESASIFIFIFIIIDRL